MERLRSVIQDAYRVFARYKIGPSLDVCHCPVCMTVATEKELIGTPLPQIRSATLAEYTNSAHAWNDTVAREMRYFLPRYLELLAAGDPPDCMGPDVCLRRLAKADWSRRWPRDEAAVIDHFFDELLVARLSCIEPASCVGGWVLGSDMCDVLSLAVTAGADIGRLLALWEAAADPPAAIHMAALRQRVHPKHGRPVLNSPFLNAHREAADKIGAFLQHPKTSLRIEATFFTVSDPRLQAILSAAV